MGVPTTKEEWRQYCAYRPTPDDRRPNLSSDEVAAMSAPDKHIYDQRRIRYINEERVFPTKELRACAIVARRLLLASESPKFVARRGMRLSGPARTGKSTDVMWAGKQLETRLRVDLHREGDLSFLPVIYVSINAATTPNKLWVKLAEFVGVRQLKGGNADERLINLAHLLRDLGTRFVIIDDVQRLNTDYAGPAAVADALKSFAESVDATMIYAGISLDTAPLFSGPAGEQWRARTSPVEMRGYSQANETLRQEWEQLAATFEHYLPLTQHDHGLLQRNADYLYSRTGGSIGLLSDLISDAATEAILTGEERITLDLLETMPVNDSPTNHEPTDTH